MSWLRSAVPPTLGAVLGCVAGLTYASLGPTAAAAKKVPARMEPTTVSAAQDDQELATLSTRVRSLEQRVSLLTAALGAAGANVAQARGEQGEGEPGQDDQGGAIAAADVADPVFEAAVRDILDRIDDERREEQTTRMQQRARYGAQRAADRLTEELGLTQVQQQELFDIMKKHYESLAALRDENAPDRPATPGEWRDKMRELRQATDDRMKGALSPAQLEKYDALDSSEFFGGRPRRPERANRD